MTVPFSARRRAEEFDALVSGAAPAGRDRAASPTPGPPLTERDAQRFADLLALVEDLRDVPAPDPRAEFTASLRERLMAEADTVLVAQSTRRREDEARLTLPVRPRSRDRRVAALLGGAAVLGATTSMAVAAQTALPGDSLYPVKRSIEDARTGLSSTDAGRGERLLASARGRLAEVDALTRDDSPTRDAAVADTLMTFEQQATEAADLLLDAYAESGDEKLVRSLRTFTATGLDRLGLLEPDVPDAARDELVDAGGTLAEIDARAATACPVCGGGVSTVPPFLLTASAPGREVGTVLLESSASIVDRGRSGTQAPIPSTISGQDVGGIVVPDLDTTLPTAPGGGDTGGTTGGTTGGGGSPSPTLPGKEPAAPVKDTVDGVTKLLTGDVPDLVEEVPVVGPAADPVVEGVGGVVGGVGGVGDTLDQTGGTVEGTGDSLLD